MSVLDTGRLGDRSLRRQMVLWWLHTTVIGSRFAHSSCSKNPHRLSSSTTILVGTRWRCDAACHPLADCSMVSAPVPFCCRQCHICRDGCRDHYWIDSYGVPLQPWLPWWLAICFHCVWYDWLHLVICLVLSLLRLASNTSTDINGWTRVLGTGNRPRGSSLTPAYTLAENPNVLSSVGVSRSVFLRQLGLFYFHHLSADVHARCSGLQHCHEWFRFLHSVLGISDFSSSLRDARWLAPGSW